MGREYFVGQRSPLGYLSDDNVSVAPADVVITPEQINSMTATQYLEFIKRPGAVEAIDRAYAAAQQPPAAVPPVTPTPSVDPPPSPVPQPPQNQ